MKLYRIQKYVILVNAYIRKNKMIPYKRIDYFKELLVKFYESDHNQELKNFFKDECILRNPDYTID